MPEQFDNRPDGSTGALAGGPATLLPLVYDELRRLAARYLNHEAPGNTLQPTALVHEAYLQLARRLPDACLNRDEFLGFAANSMRRILVDHARRRGAEKRGGGWRRKRGDGV